MWTWSFTAQGTRRTVLTDIAAAALPAQESTGQIDDETGTHVMRDIVRADGELEKFEEAKRDALDKIIAMPVGVSGWSVGCSGNAQTYNLSVRPLAVPVPNIHNLVSVIHDAEDDHGLELWPGAIDVMRSIVERHDKRIAAKAADAQDAAFDSKLKGNKP